jgi:NitT/TauT family transport system substrate-binding protein
MSNKPKPAFYLAILAVVIALVGLAIWRFGGDDAGGDAAKGKTTADGGKAPTLTKEEMDQVKQLAEADTPDGITTVKEYAYVPAERLPDVKGVSDYKPMKDEVVKFSINVWAGWAPIIYANEGFKPGKLWKTPEGKEFKVELVLIDDPVAMRDAFASGDVHVGWGTVDMLPLLLESLSKDSRAMPRIFQQIDWSNGGDGIVVRDTIKTMSDLRGQTVVLAQNSPSQFFILNALINAGVQPAEVNFKYTSDAFEAAAAFNADKSLAGVVSWAPDIYNLEKVPGNKLIVSTLTANKLIADVWFARADFAKDHHDVCAGLVRGIFDAMVALKDQPAKVQVSKWMAAGYSIPESETLGMLADAHWTNYAENRDFFMNQNNPTNFERTYDTAFFLYKKIRVVETKVAFDQLVDFSVLQSLAKVESYASHKNEYEIKFAPTTAAAIQAESEEILTKTVVIHFYPNSWDLQKVVIKDVEGKATEVRYDPNADFVVEEVGKLAGQYGAARVVIEGHTDSSMKGRTPAEVVKELATNRSNAVKEALVKAFPSLSPNQFSASGVGWDRPADPADPNNHAKNRRVEIKVYPAEAMPE